VATASSGLTDADGESIDGTAAIRQHTTERFRPVRAVEADPRFRAARRRHRRGATVTAAAVAVRFPRIARWRTQTRAPRMRILCQTLRC